MRLALLALLALPLLGCGESASGAPPRPTSTASPALSVRVRSATIDYYRAGPTDPVVELRVVLENGHTRHSDSTTILWDPAFAQSFTFLGSDPPPWRARLEETGWGSLDTDGVIPTQFATYRLWFAAGTYAPLEPRLRIVANGDTLVAEVTARASHLVWQVPRAEQLAFERGPLALVSRTAGFLPAGPGPGFLYALGLGATLLAATLCGGFQAYRLVTR